MMRIELKPEDGPVGHLSVRSPPPSGHQGVSAECGWGVGAGFLPDSGWPGLPASSVFLCKLAPGLSHT